MGTALKRVFLRIGVEVAESVVVASFEQEMAYLCTKLNSHAGGDSVLHLVVDRLAILARYSRRALVGKSLLAEVEVCLLAFRKEHSELRTGSYLSMRVAPPSSVMGSMSSFQPSWA